MDQRTNAFQIKYNDYKQTLETLQAKIIELGHDKDEHDVVLSTLKNTDENRKCYRMINSALVETDVKTTIPILSTKRANLEEAIEKMKAELIKTAEEFENGRRTTRFKLLSNNNQ